MNHCRRRRQLLLLLVQTGGLRLSTHLFTSHTGNVIGLFFLISITVVTDVMPSLSASLPEWFSNTFAPLLLLNLPVCMFGSGYCYCLTLYIVLAM